LAQEKEKLTEQDQQEVIFERHYERHMPRGLGFSAGYAMFNEFDFSVFSICCAYPIRITGWRRIHLGWDPLHLRIDDIGVSDDALLPMGGFFLFYGIETIVRNIKGTNDLSLRFSAQPSGFFFDTGVRLEKNFVEDFKCRFFIQLGFAGNG